MERLRGIFSNKKYIKLARLLFIINAGFLFAVNFAVHALAYKDGVLSLLVNFALPLVIIAVACILNRRFVKSECLLDYTLVSGIKLMGLLWFAVTLLYGAVFGVNCDYPLVLNIDYSITVFALISMAIVPYLIEDCESSLAIIIFEALAFSVFAARFNNNSAAVVTILITAAVLIIFMVDRGYSEFDGRSFIFLKILAVVILAVFVCVLFHIEASGFSETFAKTSSARNFDISFTSEYVDGICKKVVTNAEFVGSVEVEGVSVFASGHSRIYTVIIAAFGYIGIVPIIVATELMLLCALFLAFSTMSYRSYLGVGATAIIAVQSVLYLYLCLGIDRFWIPEFCPLLDGNFISNLISLLMAACICNLSNAPIGYLEYLKYTLFESETKAENDFDTDHYDE